MTSTMTTTRLFRNHQSVSNAWTGVRAYYPSGVIRKRWIQHALFTEIVDINHDQTILLTKRPSDKLKNPEILIKETDIRYSTVNYTLHIGMKQALKWRLHLEIVHNNDRREYELRWKAREEKRLQASQAKATLIRNLKRCT
jgi:hypothetical protein